MTITDMFSFYQLHEVLSIQLYTDFLGKYLTCYGINHLNSEALLDLVRDCVHVLQLQTEVPIFGTRI